MDIRDAELFYGMTKEECNKFIEITQPIKKHLQKNEILTDEDVVVDTFGVLLSGRLQGARYRYEGDIDLVDVFTEGDMIQLDTVCSPTRISPMQISAMEDAEVALFNRSFVSDTKSPNFILPTMIYKKINSNIIKILANESIKKMYKIDVLYQKSLRKRILTFLRGQEVKHKSSEFSIHMDREQFAQYLGVNRSALSHELSMMRKEKIIDFHKDNFEILKHSKG